MNNKSALVKVMARQAIIWTNDGLTQWLVYMYVSQGVSESTQDPGREMCIRQ